MKYVFYTFLAVCVVLFFQCRTAEKIHGVYSFHSCKDTVLYIDKSGFFSVHRDLKFSGIGSPSKNIFIDGTWKRDGENILLNAFKQPHYWEDLKIKKYESEGNKGLEVKINFYQDSLSKFLFNYPWIFIEDSKGVRYKIPNNVDNFNFKINHKIKWFRLFGSHLSGVYPEIPVTSVVKYIEIDVFHRYNSVTFDFSKFYFNQSLRIINYNTLMFNNDVILYKIK
ncbi:MAG: hypothetical protein MH137_05585 [Flavobacteriales bacterium]|nr:hypothetical protein [Flavobacteriales bacterium]